jgi:hypothetical protein
MQTTIQSFIICFTASPNISDKMTYLSFIICALHLLLRIIKNAVVNKLLQKKFASFIIMHMHSQEYS